MFYHGKYRQEKQKLLQIEKKRFGKNSVENKENMTASSLTSATEKSNFPANTEPCTNEDLNEKPTKNSDFNFIINTSVLTELIEFMKRQCESCGILSKYSINVDTTKKSDSAKKLP